MKRLRIPSIILSFVLLTSCFLPACTSKKAENNVITNDEIIYKSGQTLAENGQAHLIYTLNRNIDDVDGVGVVVKTTSDKSTLLSDTTIISKSDDKTVFSVPYKYENTRKGVTEKLTSSAYVEEDGIKTYSSPSEFSVYQISQSAVYEGDTATVASNIKTLAESSSLIVGKESCEATITGFDSISYTGNELTATETLNFANAVNVQLNTVYSSTFNYYTISYTSTKDVKGYLTYTSSAGTQEKETFFMSAGISQTFSSYIGACTVGGGESGSNFNFLSFENLDSEACSISFSITTSTVDYPEYSDEYAESGNYSLGASLMNGGAIQYLEYFAADTGYVNLIKDTGDKKYISQELLGTSSKPYEGTQYNPTMFEDSNGNLGKLIDYKLTDGQLYIKYRPIDAGNPGVLSDCYIETTYTAYDNYIRVDSVTRDFYEYGHENYATQKFPMGYIIPEFELMAIYNGTSPWTDAGLSYHASTQEIKFNSANTEKWFAFMDANDFAFGIYVPDAESVNIEFTTDYTYFSANRNAYIPNGEPLKFSYLISLGDIDSVRECFKTNKDFTSGSATPDTDAPDSETTTPNTGTDTPVTPNTSYTESGSNIITNQGATAPNYNNYKQGPLVAIDDTGRVLQTAEQTSNIQTGKKVGLFYFLWLGETTDSGVFDVTKILAANPNAGSTTSGWGPLYAPHFFAEPLYGYYYSSDTWVMRKHVEEFINAGVDFLFFDATNGFAYETNARALMQILHEYNAQGWDAPEVVFYTNTSSASVVETVYTEIYSENYMSDTWLKINNKPVIIAHSSQLSSTMKNFFTIREPQWPTESKKTNAWPWISFYRWSSDIFYNSAGQAEAINVSVSQHCGTGTFSDSAFYGTTSNHGRSYHNGSSSYSSTSYLYGYNFQEEWNKAINANTPYVLVTSWNEWIAERQSGTTSKPIKFIDTVTLEFSRDIEMTRGAYFDNYYMQMIYNIRKYKGVAPTLHQSKVANGYISTFDDWDNIQVTYRDFMGDTVGRSNPGFGGQTYTNTTGRNDIVAAKVAFDNNNVYFYVETSIKINSYNASASWMQLMINADNGSSGWYGYDYILNNDSPTDTTLSLSRYTGSGKNYAFTKCADVSYQISKNKMMVTIPLSTLGMNANDMEFSFKWADSSICITTPEQLYTDGDTAPHGRLNYLFVD